MNGSANRYWYFAAVLLVVSCNWFGSAPPRQCYGQAGFNVVVNDELHVLKNGQKIYSHSLLPHMAVVTGIRKDTIFLTYFREKDGAPEEGRAQAGDSVWLKWKILPQQELITGHPITATAFSFVNGRLMVQPAGSAVKLSFALDNIVYDNKRVLAFSHKPGRTSCREIKLPKELQRDFEDAFSEYSAAWGGKE